MKKQNKNKLIFKKDSVLELNDHQLHDINGGFPITITLSSAPCGAAIGSLITAVVDHFVDAF